MSWESMSKTDRPCPCGQGLYTVHSEMDDWNRHRESWEMRCPKCKEAYILQSEGVVDSGMSYERYFWARKENVKKHNVLIESAEKLMDEASSKARERYLEQWKNTLEGKSKKCIWSIITNNGEHYPSLSTFYKHVKHEGLEKYLNRAFEGENARALKILGVEDAELVQLRGLANELEFKAKKLLKET